MSSIPRRLVSWKERIGPGFEAAISPNGILREWMVGHLVEATGYSQDRVETSIDEWFRLARFAAPQPSAESVATLDDWINKLIDERHDLKGQIDTDGIARLDCEIGAALADAGRPYDALSRFMAAREVFDDTGELVDAGICDMEMGLIATDLGWYDEARAAFDRGRQPIAQYGTVGEYATLLVAIAGLEGRVSNHDTSVELLEKARSLAYEAGQLRTFAVATHNLANDASREGDLPRSLGLFDEARDVYQSLGDPVAVADCDKNAGSALINNGDYEDGLELATTALDTYVERGYPIEAAQAHRTIAHALDHLGDHDDAVGQLRTARRTFKTADRLRLAADCDIDMSYSLRSLGLFHDAATAVRRARTVYSEIGQDADDQWFDRTLTSISRGEVDRHEHPTNELDEPN